MGSVRITSQPQNNTRTVHTLFSSTQLQRSTEYLHFNMYKVQRLFPDNNELLAVPIVMITRMSYRVLLTQYSVPTIIRDQYCPRCHRVSWPIMPPSQERQITSLVQSRKISTDTLHFCRCSRMPSQSQICYYTSLLNAFYSASFLSSAFLLS